MSIRALHQLRQLARLYGVQSGYIDAAQNRCQAEPESLVAALQLLGAPIQSPDEAPAILRHAQQLKWQQPTEPVTAVWPDQPAYLELRIPAFVAHQPLSCQLRLESGETKAWTRQLSQTPTIRSAQSGGVVHVAKKLSLPGNLPYGYHRLELDAPGLKCQTLLLSAPPKAYSHNRAFKGWGLFLPLYALRSERSWCAGDYSDLTGLIEWTSELGGSVVGTLPLLPGFYDWQYEPSPYSPVSRIFWNEYYIDIDSVHELADCAEARELIASAGFRRRLRRLQNSAEVDYRREMELKRKALWMLSRRLFANDSPRRRELESFIRDNPGVEDYARFRAVCEKERVGWRNWPERMRAGQLRPGDFSEETRQYHLYVQWLAHEQLASVSRASKQLGVELYLDLPLGVHADGYDVWREQELFVQDAEAGAPPDLVFGKGQKWGFAPLHPQRVREQGYKYVIAVLRHHLSCAGWLRIDHVMGLHRLFWVPKGLPASQGVYVSYPADEFYAVLNIESHRHKAVVVGENLGTVPPVVNSTMARRGIRKMYVVQYELRPNPGRPLRRVPAKSVASLNTHDMPPFNAFWQDLDIADRLDLNLLSPAELRKEKRLRNSMRLALIAFLRRKNLVKTNAPNATDIYRACLEYLASSPAELTLVNLEDVWLEIEQQNVPGTSRERVNWRKKAKFALEEFRRTPDALEILGQLDRIIKLKKK